MREYERKQRLKKVGILAGVRNRNGKRDANADNIEKSGEETEETRLPEKA